MDTHLSSIFTAIVLYVVGNDQLKGFGISLTVGLIISLFTSLYMTRTIFEIWLYKGWLKELRFFNGLVRLIHARYWDFMSIRQYWFTGTIILTVVGAALFIYRLDSDPKGGKSSVLNIDFIGGTAYTAQLSTPMSLQQLREKLELGSPLPDQSIEQIFPASDESTGDKKPVLHGSHLERDAKKVFDFVQERLGDDLKRIKLSKIDIVKPGLEAKLYFTTQDGKEPDYASPAQVQMLIADEFAKHDLGRAGFSVDRPTEQNLSKENEDHYSQLTVKVSDPLATDKARAAELFQEILKGVQADFDRSPQPERLENSTASSPRTRRTGPFYAILASWAAILLYLWFRFGNWTFGPGHGPVPDPRPVLHARHHRRLPLHPPMDPGLATSCSSRTSRSTCHPWRPC